MADTDRRVIRSMFEVLVREHHRSLLAYARILLADKDLAEDAVQDAFLVAFRKFEAGEPIAHFGAYLRGVLRHRVQQLLDERRREPSADPASLAVAAGDGGVDFDALFARIDDRIDRPESLWLALERCLRALPENIGRAIEHFYLRSRPVREVAERLRVSEAAIKKRLQAGRGLLRRCLAEIWETADAS